MSKKYYNEVVYKNLGVDYLAVTDLNKKIIVINNRIKFNKIKRDIIIAHESAHIIVKTFEHSILWERVFFELLYNIKKKYGTRLFNINYYNLLNKYDYDRKGKYYGSI